MKGDKMQLGNVPSNYLCMKSSFGIQKRDKSDVTLKLTNNQILSCGVYSTVAGLLKGTTSYETIKKNFPQYKHPLAVAIIKGVECGFMFAGVLATYKIIKEKLFNKFQ